jgi:hypothetical protein
MLLAHASMAMVALGMLNMQPAPSPEPLAAQVSPSKHYRLGRHLFHRRGRTRVLADP